GRGDLQPRRRDHRAVPREARPARPLRRGDDRAHTRARRYRLGPASVQPQPPVSPAPRRPRARVVAGRLHRDLQRPRGVRGRQPARRGVRGPAPHPRGRRERRASRFGDRQCLDRGRRVRRPRRLRRRRARRRGARSSHRSADPPRDALRRLPQMAEQTKNEDPLLTPSPSRHVEDPTIEELAEEAGHTDEVAVRRTLFGWRELVSTLIPLALIAVAARNVDWGEAGRALARSQPYLVVLALVVYYATFPLRSWRWARLLREGGTDLGWSDLLRILFLGWFVNCVVPAKLGDLYRSFLVKRRFGVSLSRTVGVVVAERLLDLLVVFLLLIVGGYVAFGRTILPDLRIVYVTGAALALLIVAGIAAMYYVAPTLARFFPAEVRRIGRLFREGVLHSFRALPLAGPLTVVIWAAEAL